MTKLAPIVQAHSSYLALEAQYRTALARIDVLESNRIKANTARTAKARARQEWVTPLGRAYGWGSGGKAEAIIESIRTALADANGNKPSVSTIRNDLLFCLGPNSVQLHRN